MNVPFFDLKRQFSAIRTDVDAAVAAVMGSQGFILGPTVADFESSIADILGVDHVIGCASGTDALLLPLKAMGLESGDEVIVPAFTFFATAGAVVNAGLEPVFCDVDPDTFNVTVETLDAVRTDRTRAVVPVHLFGQMAPMAGIMEWAERHDVLVLEDVAQSMGARQQMAGVERAAGSVGHAASFSFFPTKNLGGAGDGGCVAATVPALAKHVRSARTHGGVRMYDHEFVGTNSRLDALQAAILAAKLPHLDGWLKTRRENAAFYLNQLTGIEGLVLPHVAEGNYHTFNQFTVRTPFRDKLKAFLDEAGVGSKVYYPKALHLQKCFEGGSASAGDLPVSESLTRTVLSLPIFPELTTGELAVVVAAVTEFFASAETA